MTRRDKKGRTLWKGEYQRSNGMYEYKYTENGKPHSVYSWRLVQTDKNPVGKKSEKCLREMEREIERDLQDGMKVAQAKKLTLNAFFEEYIETKVGLKQSTRTNYKYMYNKYVSTSLGQKKITQIRYSDIIKFYNYLINDIGFKPNSMEVIQTILHPVFKTAVRDSYIRLNPTDGVMAEIKNSHNWEKGKRHSLTEAQQTAFMTYISKTDKYNHWLPLFTVFLGTGCRVGEIIGLRWEDCDFENNLISINHNLIYRQQDSGKCEFHITTPKTKSGIRVIPMLKDVKKALLKEQELQAEKGRCKSIIDDYSGFIFRNRFGTVFSPHLLNRAIDRIIKDYNSEESQIAEKENRSAELLPHFSVHNLRHTFCTRFCENETNIKIIQEIMGHADIKTTMDIYN
ncbi:MAG: tyrosine-type recombinase/integrase, partial [Clostridiales bacterium]|nr:tyrosine-type recombinase/integrase [Clostridiales bacterium]